MVTSHPISGDTGEPTGFAMVELTHPLAVFREAGIPAEIASIRGGHPPIDSSTSRIRSTTLLADGVPRALARSLVLSDSTPPLGGCSSPAAMARCGTFADNGPSSVSSARSTKPAVSSRRSARPGRAGQRNALGRQLLVAGKKIASFTDEEEARSSTRKSCPICSRPRSKSGVRCTSRRPTGPRRW